MSFKLLESNKLYYLATSFDMSSNTDITFTFTKPSGATVTKTLTGGEITLGTINTTLPAPVGAVLANEYAYYTVEAGFLDEAGDWCAYCTYSDTGTTPVTSFDGDADTFTVAAAPCS